MNNINSYHTLDKKDRVDFYIALAVIISVLSFILYYSFDDLFSDKNVSLLDPSLNEIQMYDTIVIEGQEYVPFIGSEENLSHHIEEEQEGNIQLMAVSDSTLLLTDDNDSATYDAENILGGELMEDTLHIATDGLDVNNVDTTVLEVDITNVKEKMIESDTVIVSENQKDEIEQEEDIALDKSCIIAVGLYKNAKNANKMMSRLKNGGYNAFITVRRSRRQVQVYHSCNSNTLNKSLMDIRKRYASDAIVLIKD